MKRHSIFKKLEKPKPPPPLLYFKEEVDDPLFERNSSQSPTDVTTTVCCCPYKDEVVSLQVAIARLEKIVSEQSRLLQRISTKVNLSRTDDSDDDDDGRTDVDLLHLSELVRFPITTDEELVAFDETLNDSDHHQRVVSTVRLSMKRSSVVIVCYLISEKTCEAILE